MGASTTSPQESSCLLVIDAQVQFRNDHTAAIYPAIEALLPRFDFVVASRLVRQPGGPLERWKRWIPAERGEPGFEFCVDFSSVPEDRLLIAEKTLFDGFSPAVRSWLAQREVRTVHLCGGDTDLCVALTAAGVMASGMRPLLVSDLCGSYAGEPLHSHGLLQLKRMLGKAQIITSTSSLMPPARAAQRQAAVIC